MKAKKSLGQHFLQSEKALRDITGAASLIQSDTVLEIGPGKGALTRTLLQEVHHVLAVETDSDMIEILQNEFHEEITTGALTLIKEDILSFEPETIKGEYKLVANIPYYITGAIIEQFLSTPHKPNTMVLLVQKEVAERIIARDGKESILSIAVKAYGIPKLVSKVPRGAFVPSPTVDSAVLLVSGISGSFFDDCDETYFFQVLKAIFGKKRKQIGGSLGEFLSDKEKAYRVLRETNIDTKTRPEDLTLTKWKELIVALADAKNSVQ